MKFLVLKNDFYNLVEMLYFLATSQLSQMTGVPLKITYCKRVSSCPNLVLPHRDMLLKWPHRAQILHYKQTYILTCNNFRPYIVFVHLVASIQGTDFLNTILRIQGRPYTFSKDRILHVCPSMIDSTQANGMVVDIIVLRGQLGNWSTVVMILFSNGTSSCIKVHSSFPLCKSQRT